MPPSAPRKSPTLNPEWPNWLSMGVITVALFAGLMRFFVIEMGDKFHCNSLLTTGQWLDPGTHKNWQPDGCMTHKYSQKDVSTCLASRRLLFIGDSITRQLFFSMARTADPSLPEGPTAGEKHRDYTFLTTATGGEAIEFEFRWDPFLNSTSTMTLLSHPHTPLPSYQAPQAPQPALLVLGSGLWYLRHPSTGGLAAWESQIDKIFNMVSESSPTKTNPNLLADEIVFLPVLEPVEEKLSEERKATLQRPDVDAMNSDLSARLTTAFSISSSFSSNTGGSQYSSSHPPPPISIPLAFNELLPESETIDGLHYSPAILGTQSQILYNLRCNDVLPKNFPLDKTCCRKYPALRPSQWLVLFFVVAWAALGRLLSRQLSHYPKLLKWFPSEEISPALTIFGIAIALLFFSDRTGVWSKESKAYDPITFGTMCLATLVAGLATMKVGDKDLGYLNREQTDEWKGWMQIAILIYHYIGASKISGIYNPIRACVAAYLFMTGYGHFTFYYKKADYGINRIAMVMVRLNILPLVLAYTMQTTYISYYFSPLVSFWYLIIYGTMVLGSKYNDKPAFILGKLAASCAFVTWFMKAEWPLEYIFKALSIVANVNWSAKEWYFRVTLDLWIVYVGMLTAYAFIKIKDLGLTNHALWPNAVKATTGLSAIALVWFMWFELTCENKFAYNKWHPLVSAVPVLAFTVLRNATPFLRSVNSKVFMFIGQCSLETFILQYHIWLAADTKGILIVVPGTKWRYVNVVFTSIIFIFLSHKVAGATGEMTTWVLGKMKKKQPAAPVGGSSNGGGESSIPLLPTSGDKSAAAPVEGGGGVGMKVNKSDAEGAALEEPPRADLRKPSWPEWMFNLRGPPTGPSVSAKSTKVDALWKHAGARLLMILGLCWALNWFSQL